MENIVKSIKHIERELIKRLELSFSNIIYTQAELKAMAKAIHNQKKTGEIE